MTTDLVPAANMAAIEAMEPATREVAVTHMLSEARQWLAHAVETTGPQQIAEFKAWVATVEESTRQLNLSKEIQLDATEMVRRAERGIGVAVRRGQAAGEIASKATPRTQPPYTRVLRGQEVAMPGRVQDREPDLRTPREFFGSNETRTDTYAMTDGVTDEQFEGALSEAKAEGNLARANVIRKIRQEPASSRSDRPEVLRKTRHLDSNRIVEQTVLAVEGIGALLDQVEYTELDRRSLQEWVSSLSEALRALRSLKTNIEKELNRG